MINRCSHRNPAPSRHGIVTLKLVLAAGLLFSLLAMVIDLGLLIARTESLKTLTDAAALAGAAALAENMGFSDNDGRDFPTAETPEVFGSESLVSIVREVHRQSARFAFANPIAGHRLRLWNHVDGDVTAGWVEHAHVCPDFLFEIRPGGPLNAVEVHARLPVDHLSALSLSLFQLARRRHLHSTSVAVFDQKLVGFRPVGSANVPLLPLLVSLQLSDKHTESGDDGEGRHDGDGEGPHEHDGREPEQGQREDEHSEFLLPGGNFELILQPGLVTVPHHHEHGRHPHGALWGVPLQFGTNGSIEEFSEQIIAGLDFESLTDRRGAILIDGDGDVDVPVHSGLAVGQIEILEALFSRVIGEPRVLPIGHVQGGMGIGEITDFMAVVVTGVHRSNSQIRLSLSPVRMHTSTALVADSAARNPWIGKVVLVK
jgi:hypothetical protein